MTTKTVASFTLALILTAIATSAEARRGPQKIPAANYEYTTDRHAINGYTVIAPEWRHVERRNSVSYTKRHAGKQAKPGKKRYKIVTPARKTLVARSYRGAAQIVEHPAGCPRTSFCGCGTALHIFGRPIRDLWLAANWFRFPASTPGPGKVAVRRHHVFAILKDLGGGRVLAYDPNSGGHKTRVWVRSLAGYRVVDPGRKQNWAYAG